MLGSTDVVAAVCLKKPMELKVIDLINSNEACTLCFTSCILRMTSNSEVSCIAQMYFTSFLEFFIFEMQIFFSIICTDAGPLPGRQNRNTQVERIENPANLDQLADQLQGTVCPFYSRRGVVLLHGLPSQRPGWNNADLQCRETGFVVISVYIRQIYCLLRSLHSHK